VTLSHGLPGAGGYGLVVRAGSVMPSFVRSPIIKGRRGSRTSMQAVPSRFDLVLRDSHSAEVAKAPVKREHASHTRVVDDPGLWAGPPLKPLSELEHRLRRVAGDRVGGPEPWSVRSIV
jgi:hypothetical protein